MHVQCTCTHFHTLQSKYKHIIVIKISEIGENFSHFFAVKYHVKCMYRVYVHYACERSENRNREREFEKL